MFQVTSEVKRIAMSKLRTPSTRKPPVCESASRIPQPSRMLRSNISTVQTTPVSLMKPHIPNRSSSAEKMQLRSEYQSISSNFQALAKMVEDEFGNHESGNAAVESSVNVDPNVVYERGRFYEEYSARRNERLKRNKSLTGQEKKPSYNLGVTVEPGKKRDGRSLRKSVPPNFAVNVNVNETPRYSLRSSCKENKKPPLAPMAKLGVDSAQKIGTRRTRRI